MEFGAVQNHWNYQSKKPKGITRVDWKIILDVIVDFFVLLYAELEYTIKKNFNFFSKLLPIPPPNLLPYLSYKKLKNIDCLSFL